VNAVLTSVLNGTC